MTSTGRNTHVCASDPGPAKFEGNDHDAAERIVTLNASSHSRYPVI